MNQEHFIPYPIKFEPIFKEKVWGGQNLKTLFGKHLALYDGDGAAAEQLIKTGQTPPAADVNASELAAWTSVARVILNLHETITRS